MSFIKTLPKFDDITYKPEPILLKDTPLISFSQIQMYTACPNKWKLRYIDKNRIDKYNIHLLFGTAMHQTIQMYLHYIFNVSVKEADAINLNELLHHYMVEIYQENDINEKVDMDISRDDMAEFYNDGVRILDWLKTNRLKYFSTKTYKLFAIEFPIYTLLEDYGVAILQKLDIVLQDKKTKEYLIIDLKTATKSWNDYKKKDDVIRTQLILYRTFFSHIMNIPLEQIKTVFYVLKRKVLDPETVDFPVKVSYIQKVDVPHGNVTINKSKKIITDFLEGGFDGNGSYLYDKTFDKKTGRNNFNCNYCPYNTDEYCTKTNRS